MILHGIHGKSDEEASPVERNLIGFPITKLAALYKTNASSHFIKTSVQDQPRCPTVEYHAGILSSFLLNLGAY